MVHAAKIIVALATFIGSAAAQMGGMGSGKRQRDKEAVMVKADVKHIECDVCQMAMEHVFDEVETKRAEAPSSAVYSKPGQKKVVKSMFSEQDVNDVLLEVCHRRKKGGMWTWYTDLVEAGGGAGNSPGPGARFHRPLSKAEKSSGARFLLVADTEEPGKWDHERATLMRACDDVMDGMDLDELAVALWKGVEDKKAAVKLGCKELNRVCKGQGRKALPKGRNRDDAPHEPTDKQMVETEQMMQNMEEAGSPMVMQSREDIELEMAEMAEEMGMSKEEMDSLMASGGPGGEGGGEALGGGGEL